MEGPAALQDQFLDPKKQILGSKRSVEFGLSV